jgi:hypothetical protein
MGKDSEMTTFTSDDREEAYKKILEEAPAHIGYEDAVDPVALNVEPIPFAGWVNTSPPHIVDSGASVMIKELTDEEIAEVAKDFFLSQYVPYDFVRAILKKAQKK